MKRKWSLRLGAAVLCAVLLGSCGVTAAAPAESTAPADPLTGQQLLYPEQRAAAVVIGTPPAALPSGASAAPRWCWKP